jgi:hypothetical protein
MSSQTSAEHSCAACGSPAVPFGQFCSACYGGVLHPNGCPISPGNSGDPWRAFNAEADAWLLDRQMPPADQVLGVIEVLASRRTRFNKPDL